MRVLILCTANSAGSQMAEGLPRRQAGPSCRVFSAGIKPTRIRPETIAVMCEAGIDLSGHQSKSVDEFVGQEFDYVITVCDTARETCPAFLARTCCIHWSIEDPAANNGSEKERLEAFWRARDELQKRLRGFVREQTAPAAVPPRESPRHRP